MSSSELAHDHATGHNHHSALDQTFVTSGVDIYDTTLRDGSQQEGISLSVDDKIRVAAQLDHLGVTYIEGGWPGANPKDAEFFARVRDELTLEHAQLVAFGATRRAGISPTADELLAHLVAAETETVCIVGKASSAQVTGTLRTSLEEALLMVEDTVSFLRANGRRVMFDLEHFFDGYRLDRDFSLSVLDTAQRAGAEVLVLCDTNGGTLPDRAGEVIEEVRAVTGADLGVHFHNDSGCAVANSLAAVAAGVVQVQGCINGYGERAGNTDLSVAIPNLSLKMDRTTIPNERIQLITPVARHIAEIVNINIDPQKPYVGGAAFAHKAGLHTSVIARKADAYNHIDPEVVGNGTRVVVSELAGRSTLAMKAVELGIELDPEATSAVLDALKHLEHAGYHFEVADGSLELLMRAAAGGTGVDRFFSVESFRVISEWRRDESFDDSGESRLVHPWDENGALTTEATVKVHVGDRRVVATAEGNGPVNALDGALREAIGSYFPELAEMHLTDYRVRVLDSSKGTGAATRVLLDTADEEGSYSTIGVSENIIESSWQALVDAVVFGLVRAARRDRSNPEA